MADYYVAQGGAGTKAQAVNPATPMSLDTAAGETFVSGDRWLLDDSGGSFVGSGALITAPVLTLRGDRHDGITITAKSGSTPILDCTGGTADPYNTGIYITDANGAFSVSLSDFAVQKAGNGDRSTQVDNTQNIYCYGNVTVSLSNMTITKTGDQNVHMVANGASVPTVIAINCSVSDAYDDGYSIHAGTLSIVGGTISLCNQGLQDNSSTTNISTDGTTFTNNLNGMNTNSATLSVSNCVFNIYDDAGHVLLGRGLIHQGTSSSAIVQNSTFNILSDSGDANEAYGLVVQGANSKITSKNNAFIGTSQKGYGIYETNPGIVNLQGANTFTDLSHGIFHNTPTANSYSGMTATTCRRGFYAVLAGATIKKSIFNSCTEDGVLGLDNPFSVQYCLFLITTGDTGIRCQNAGATTVSVKNCTFIGYGGSKVGYGIRFQNAAQVQTISNNIFKNLLYGVETGVNTAVTYSNNCFYFNNTHRDADGAYTDGGGNLADDTDPKLLADYRLQGNSPCRNVGTNTAHSGTANITDLANYPITNAAGGITAFMGTVDIGAYEWVGGGGGLSPGLGLSGGNRPPWWHRRRR